uniref:Putative methyltransferase n=1 Tax=viral metagenome TaxID=1070528 RepID=A0A6M3IIV8_9ZZZZ
MKLNLGCGDHILHNYINCDLYCDKAQIKCNVNTLPFKDNSIDEIYSSHVIEHFNFKEAFNVLKEWLRVLKVGAKVIIETPDLLESCKKFIELNDMERIGMYAHFFSEPWIDGQWHKFLYTSTQLKWTLEQCGFKDTKQFRACRYIGKEDICLGMEGTK